MAIHFREPQKNPMWESLGTLLGSLGGLGIGYGINKASQNNQVQSFEGLGFTPHEAQILSTLPPMVQQQAVKEKMKEREAQRRSEIMGSLISPQMPQSTNSLSQPLSALNDQSSQMPMQSQMTQDPSYEQRMQAAFASLLNPQEINTVSGVLGNIEKQKYQQQMLRAKQEAPMRKEINAQLKEWRKGAKKADRDLEALENLKTIPQEEFTPNFLRRSLTKAGFGDFFLGANEEAYKKITEGLVMDKARDIASAGKITAALLDRVRLRYPALENTEEGRRIMTNILSREAEEEKIYEKVYKELRKEMNFEPGTEPLDLIDLVEDKAEQELKAFRKHANEELERDLGGTRKSKDHDKGILMQLSSAHPASQLPNGAIAKDEMGKPIARVQNGRWVAL